MAVFVTVRGAQNLSIELQCSDALKLSQAEALVTAVIDLNRTPLAAAGAVTFAEGDYTAQITLKNLKLLSASTPAANTRALQGSVDVEMKATRALRADEGKPIRRIRTPGAPVGDVRPVDIIIGIDA